MDDPAAMRDPDWSTEEPRGHYHRRRPDPSSAAATPVRSRTGPAPSLAPTREPA